MTGVWEVLRLNYGVIQSTKVLAIYSTKVLQVIAMTSQIQPLQYVGATSFYSYDLPIQPLQYQAMTLHTKVLV